jgi:hypothetical protein
MALDLGNIKLIGRLKILLKSGKSNFLAFFATVLFFILQKIDLFNLFLSSIIDSPKHAGHQE